MAGYSDVSPNSSSSEGLLPEDLLIDVQKPGHYGACAKGTYSGKPAGSLYKSDQTVCVSYLLKEAKRKEFETELALLMSLSVMNPSPYIVSVLGPCQVCVK